MSSNSLASIRSLTRSVQALPSHPKLWIRFSAILAEAFLLTVIALLIVSAMGTSEAGFFGLFLASASLTIRFQALLQENKDLIFVELVESKKANGLTALSILMVFLGICFAYLATTTTFTQAELEAFFGFIFDTTQSRTGTLTEREFSHFVPILIHNGVVMGTIAALCLLYRSYGALLTLGWNASVWVIVIAGLTRRMFGEDLLENIGIGVWAFVAIAPHLVLEGAAYVLIALAAIFYSKGVTKYLIPVAQKGPSSTASVMAMELPKDSVFYNITVACLKMAGSALVILLVAAAIEAFYAPWMLGLLREWVTP